MSSRLVPFVAVVVLFAIITLPKLSADEPAKGEAGLLFVVKQLSNEMDKIKKELKGLRDLQTGLEGKTNIPLKVELGGQLPSSGLLIIKAHNAENANHAGSAVILINRGSGSFNSKRFEIVRMITGGVHAAPTEIKDIVLTEQGDDVFLTVKATTSFDLRISIRHIPV